MIIPSVVGAKTLTSNPFARISVSEIQRKNLVQSRNKAIFDALNHTNQENYVSTSWMNPDDGNQINAKSTGICYYHYDPEDVYKYRVIPTFGNIDPANDMVTPPNPSPVGSGNYYIIGSNINGQSWALGQSDAKFTKISNGIYKWNGERLGSGFKINDGTWDNRI